MRAVCGIFEMGVDSHSALKRGEGFGFRGLIHVLSSG